MIEIVQFSLFLLFPAALAFAGAMDLLTMTIPNKISLALIVAFFLAALVVPFDWPTVASHVGAGMLMLVVGILMFSQGWLGGGDAKLLAVAALWFGFGNLLDYLVLVSIAGGLLVMGLLFYRSQPLPSWLGQQGWALRLHAKGGGVPYGIALAAAGLWLYPSTPWLTRLAV